MTAYAYLRKSSMPPGVQTMSPQAQEDAVRALARVHGDEGDIVLLADWDISGSGKFTLKRRGWQDLIAAIETGRAAAVYSYSLSRLARNTREALRFFDLCEAHRVPVRLVADAIDTATASGKMMLTILASVAQFESDVASERKLASNEAKRARGEKVVTDRPFGQKPGEDAAAVVEAFRQAGSYAGAAKLLNIQGLVRPRRAQAWRTSSVTNVIAANAPGLIARRGVKRVSAGGQPFALARLLRCGACGGMLTGRHGYGGRVQYHCSRAKTVPHVRSLISEHLIMSAVEDEAARYWNPDEMDGTTGPDTRATRREDLEARRQRVVEARLDGLLDRAAAARQCAEIDAELGRLTAPGPFEINLAMTPREMNISLRLLFEWIDLDPVTFQPVHFEWVDPAWREKEWHETP